MAKKFGQCANRLPIANGATPTGLRAGNTPLGIFPLPHIYFILRFVNHPFALSPWQVGTKGSDCPIMVHAKNRQWGDLLHATTRIGLMFSVFLMTGCGSVGEAVNPVGWYRGARDWVSGTPDRQEQGDQNPQAKGDFPNVPNDKRPVVLSGQQREDFSKGLAADRANAQYTQETIRREGTPTRPLSPEAMVAKPALPPVPAEPAASPSVVSQPAAVANVPAPALAQPELPPPPPPPPAPRPVPSAVTPPPPPPPPPPVRAEAPMPAPAPAPAPIVAPAPVIAPPPAPVAVAPATLPSNSLGVSPVAAPVTQAPSAPLSVDEIYRRRLSESNAASPQPAPTTSGTRRRRLRRPPSSSRPA